MAFLFLILVFLGIAFIMNGSIGLGITLILIPLFYGGLKWLEIADREKSNDPEIRKRKAEKEKTRKEEQKLRAVANGTWIFPSEEFYRMCLAIGLSELNNPSSEEKANTVAQQIMRENNIPEKYYSKYISRKKLKVYFDEARRPKKAALSIEQQNILNRNDVLKKKNGTKKRSCMLSEIIAIYNRKIAEKEKSIQNIQQLSGIIAMSASQTKTTDWATTAGIANGLGGPVAGFLAGTEAILQNAQIEEQNRRNREAANETALKILKGADPFYDDISTLKKQKQKWDLENYNLKNKTVLKEQDVNALFRSIDIQNTVVTKEKNNALKISANLRTDYQPKKDSRTTRMCIDGTLNGEIYIGDLLVDTVILPLPLYGLECGNPHYVTLDTICAHYAISNQSYRVEWSPNSLWVMEI